MPALVVPPVATTGEQRRRARSARSSWHRGVARRAAPVSRPRSSTGASITSMSMTRAVEAIDEWASAEATMRQRAGRSRPAAARAVGGGVAGGHQGAQVAGRAARHEAARRRPSGSPARSATQRSAWFSACTAPDPSSHDPP